MKKWYQPCSWVVMAALAIQMSGCARSSAYLSKMTGRHKDDQKLVDVDAKAGKKSSSKTSDSKGKAKATDSQLAKNQSKPKVQSRDDSAELASAKEPAKAPKKPTGRESMDPFQSEEFEALAAKKSSAKKTEPAAKDSAAKDIADSTDLIAKTTPSKAASKSSSDFEDDAKIQEVAHKVEDDSPIKSDLPDWARDGDVAQSSPAKESSAARSSAAVEKKDVRTVSAADNEFKAPKAEKKETIAARAAAEDSEPSVSLIAMCPDAKGELRELVVALNPKDVEGLKRGIHRIGRMGPEAQPAAPALVQLLKHKDGFVRTHSALALARMQASPPEAVDTVVDGLKSTDPGIRSFAAAVLAEMGPQAADALSTLAESLKDRDGFVRLHAAEVLIRYDRWSYEALETLLGGLRDKDENIRWLATYSLAELAPESQETVDALVKATHDRVLKVQVGAVYALGEIGPFAKSAGSELRKLADSTPHAELQSAILYALQQIEQ